jgi:hypothetical protein
MQVKVKGARKITYDAFIKALDQVAAKKVRACVPQCMCAHACGVHARLCATQGVLTRDRFGSDKRSMPVALTAHDCV